MRKNLSSLLAAGLAVGTFAFASPVSTFARETQGVQEFTTYEEEFFKPSIYHRNQLIIFSISERGFLLRFDTKGNGKENIVLGYEFKGFNTEGIHVKGPILVGVDRDGNQSYEDYEIKFYSPQKENPEINLNDFDKLMGFTLLGHGFLLRFDINGDGREDFFTAYRITGLVRRGYSVEPFMSAVDKDGNGLYTSGEIISNF